MSRYRRTVLPPEIHATYLVRAAEYPAAASAPHGSGAEAAAQSLAGEMSSGTFVAVPGETPELIAKHLARLIEVRPAIESERWRQFLPATSEPAVRQWFIASYGLPTANVGTNLSALFAALAGNIFEMRVVSGLRLLEVTIPAEALDKFQRPRHGLPGTWARAHAKERPLFGSIVKPSVGLDATQTAELAYELAVAGLDFLKDDELLADPPYCRFTERVDAVCAALDAAERVTGRRMMYAFNISDRTDRMLEHLDYATRRGAGAAMVVLSAVGLAAVEQVVELAAIPVHGHRAGWGLLSRGTDFGLDVDAYRTLWRLTGIDHLHVGGLASKFSESDETVARNLRGCLTPLRAGVDDRVVPVLSSAQTARQVAPTLAVSGAPNFLMLAGGGVLAHPRGPRGGVAAFHEAFDAWRLGIDVTTYARSHPDLAAALDRG